MTVPWKSWCRLCASTNGGVPILEPEGGDHFLPDKIRKYLAISVVEEEKLPCLLCSDCCDQLAAFDNFVHRCMQVQAMFTTLCDLGEDEIIDHRLIQIREEFLSTCLEVSKDVAHDDLNKKGSQKSSLRGKNLKYNGGKNQIKNESNHENGRRKLRSNNKLKESNEVAARSPLSSPKVDRRKSGRLKEIAELKRAFGERKRTYADNSDTDLEAESFDDLMDKRSSSDKETNKKKRGSIRSSSGDERKYIQGSSANMKSGLINSEDPVIIGTICSLPQEKVGAERNLRSIQSNVGMEIKSEDHLQGDEENCDVLSSDVNCVSINSLSDADINDLINDEDVGGAVDDLNVDDFKVNGSWKIATDKSEELSKSGIKGKSKEYGLVEMLNEDDEEDYEEDEEEDDDDDEEGNNVDSNEWTIDAVESGNTKGKKKTKPKEPPFYKCDKCDKSFHRKALLNVHLISHVPKEQQPYVCCKCARRFHCEALLRNHERVHLPMEERLVFPCHICSKKFSSRSAVSAHLRSIHFGERPFVCHLCGHSFTSKGILQEHLTIHSDDTPWHCTKCSKRFKTKYRLKIHMDTHRETPYSCPHCPIQLSTRRTLRMHLVVHRDTKAYQCATCGKAFRRAKDLKNHHNLHTGRRPYTCPFCSRTFANGSNCRSHKRRMHPEELRLYEAALAANGGVDPMATSNPLEADVSNNNNLIGHQDLDEDGSQSMKEDSQDTLLTGMALDLQQPQMLSVKTNLPPVPEDSVVTTAADLTLALPLTLTSTLPKLEPDDSRLVMNLTTQMHNSQDSMNAMSPLNLNIMSPLNLNISSVLPSPPGKHHHHPIVSQQHQNSGRYQHQHQPQQQPQQLTLQQPQHQSHHQQPQQHHQQQPDHQHHQHLAHQTQMHQHIHQQQLPRSSGALCALQTPHSATNSVQILTSQPQLPAHHNHITHHAPQTQSFITNNQQGSTLYGHHAAHVQDPMSPAALMAAAAVAHTMAAASNGGNGSAVPAFPGNPYVHHSMAYGRGGGM